MEQFFTTESLIEDLTHFTTIPIMLEWIDQSYFDHVTVDELLRIYSIFETIEFRNDDDGMSIKYVYLSELFFRLVSKMDLKDLHKNRHVLANALMSNLIVAGKIVKKTDENYKLILKDVSSTIKKLIEKDKPVPSHQQEIPLDKSAARTSPIIKEESNVFLKFAGCFSLFATLTGLLYYNGYFTMLDPVILSKFF